MTSTLMLLAFLCACMSACSTDLHAPDATLSGPAIPHARGLRYLALGDSYTIGQDVTEAERWPNVLAGRLRSQGANVDTVGIIARTGWTTGDLLDALDRQSPSKDHDLVSLLIGVNNEYQYRPIQEYEQEFSELLDRAVELAGGRQDRVFVVSIPDYGYTPYGQSNQVVISGRIDAFNNANRAITTARGIRYFDITPISRQDRDDFVADDGLHPSGAQYAAWVEAMEVGVWDMVRD